MIDLQGKTPKVLVIGDLMVDHYMLGACERISPEAPVPVVSIACENKTLGGAGNVCNNLRAFGAQVDIISVIGDCEISKKLMLLLKEINIDSKYLIIEKGRVASKKTRIIAAQQQVLRYDHESSNEISVESQKYILEIFLTVVNKYDIVLISDYNKGIMTFDLTQSLISSAKKANKKVIIDPKGLDYSKYKGAYLLTPNKKEAAEATQIAIKDNESLTQAIIKLKADYELDVSLITLSDQGIAFYNDRLRILPTLAREVFDVTGAGDTVLASLGFTLACGYKIDEAVKFSNLAAGVVVEKIGSATVTLKEINIYESSLNKYGSDAYIKTLEEITLLSRDLKEKGKKIIFTNGCFDILHAGHVHFLEIAKSYGDVLILGVNSDRSVSELKGVGRPINRQLDRAYILAALEVVDYVVIFDEDTPHNLIESVVPHVLVKGSDYEGQFVVGQDIAEELKLVPLVDGKSTTNTIEKIQQSE